MNGGDLNSALPSSRRWLGFVVLILLAFAVGELVMSRVHFLDDAFIHLRIAHRLLDEGRFAYNVDAPGFVTSSPLYTSVLAMFSLGSRSPLVPKVVNLLAYLSLLALVARRLSSCVNAEKLTLWLGGLVILVSPICVRWLTDGMETGMVMLTAILLAVAVARMGNSCPGMTDRVFAIGVGAAAVFLRVEFGFLLAIAIVALGLQCLVSDQKPGEVSGKKWRRALCAALPFVIGGLIGTILILGIFGHLLPDTALAKQLQRDPVAKTLKSILLAHAGASFFGMGMCLLWVASMFAAFRSERREIRMFVLVANLGMPVFLLLLIVKNQAIQGVRYFIFIEAFLTTLNILSLPAEKRELRHPRLVGIATVLAFIWVSYDAAAFYRISKGRSETYRRFAGADYSYLKDHKGIAYDIGFVGYFTDAYILDAYGLVNGREVARLTVPQRLTRYSQEKADFIFIGEDQIHEALSYLDFKNWDTVGSFDFPNFNGRPDTHWLLVRPGITPAGKEVHPFTRPTL